MLTFAWKDLFHQRGQTLLNIFGLAVVVFSYLILIALAQTMESLVKENRLNRNLIVIQADAIDPGDSTIDENALQAAESLVPSMVERVSPMIFRHLRIGERLVQLRAAPVEDWEPVHHLELIEGRWPGPTGEVAVGEGAAQANGWQIGSSLHIYGSDFRVAGIFRSPGTIFASVWLPLEAAQNLFAPRRASQGLLVKVAADADAENVRLRLQKDESLAGNYTVFFEENYTRRNTQVLRDLASLMRVLGGIALLAIIFGTYNATSLSLTERGRETGILRSVGFGKSAVRLFLIGRALFLGLVSYMVGLAAAAAYAQLQTTAAPIYIFGFPFIYQIDLFNAGSGLIWIALLAPLGAWLAAHQLLDTSISEILRRPV